MRMIFSALLFAVVFNSSSAFCQDNIFAKPVRAGVSLGALPSGGASISADIGPVILENITLGTELYGTHVFSVRGLMWEKTLSLSGFLGGPKLIFQLGPSRFGLEPAAELGWTHRFNNNADAGLGVDFVFGQYFGGKFKFFVGYLL
jgi:hypothetical protein